MHVVHALGIEPGERARKEVSLLLVVAFERDAIAGDDKRTQGIDDACGIEHRAVEPRQLQTPRLSCARVLQLRVVERASAGVEEFIGLPVRGESLGSFAQMRKRASGASF